MRIWTFLVVAFIPSITLQGADLERFTFSQPHMGTVFRIVLYAESGEVAKRASDAAFTRIAELNGVMSDYIPTSELSRLSKTSGSGQWVRLSDDLWRVLAYARDVSEISDGAFDITVGPIVRLWRRARRQFELPSRSRIDEAKARVGWQHVQLDVGSKSVKLLKPGMRLDLGGIAKGFAADEALAAMKSHGVSQALIDAGGDILLGDAPPGRPGWRVGIASVDPKTQTPARIVLLANAAMATSGDAWQYVEIEGVRYSHIVNPETGIGLTHRSSVSIIAGTGMMSDALASAVSVMGTERGITLIDTLPHVHAFVLQAGTPVRITKSADIAELRFVE